jgi:hypothetical protein
VRSCTGTRATFWSRDNLSLLFEFCVTNKKTTHMTIDAADTFTIDARLLSILVMLSRNYKKEKKKTNKNKQTQNTKHIRIVLSTPE